VDMFFALSGFLITSILLRAKQEEHYFRNFYVRRVLRIFPLYYAAVAFVLLFAPKLEPEFTKQLNVALPVIMLYQQNWAMLFNGFHITRYLGITWSLAIEEQFYFIWPFVVFFLNRDRLIKVSVGYIIVSFTARILGVFFWGNLGDVSRFFYYASFARFEEILFGALLAVFLAGNGAREQVRRYSLPRICRILIDVPGTMLHGVAEFSAPGICQFSVNDWRIYNCRVVYDRINRSVCYPPAKGYFAATVPESHSHVFWKIQLFDVSLSLERRLNPAGYILAQ
jgi:peptidoglycan/LPS O-acetylase OafA/YrhL